MDDKAIKHLRPEYIIHDIYIADLDKNGYNDIVCALCEPDKVLWLENSGSLSFTAHDISENVDKPMKLFVTDMDNDNDLDIVSGSYNDLKVVWYENDGMQTFRPHIVSQFDTEITQNPNQQYFDMGLSVADVDFDGNKDIIAGWGTTYPNHIYCYKNDMGAYKAKLRLLNTGNCITKISGIATNNTSFTCNAQLAQQVAPNSYIDLDMLYNPINNNGNQTQNGIMIISSDATPNSIAIDLSAKGLSIDLYIRNQTLEQDNIYEAIRNIYAGNVFMGDFGVTIKNTNNLQFKAGNMVVLLPGFKVERGSKFNAKIDP